MKQKNGGWIALFLAPACILFILIFAIPLVMVFVTSLFDYRLLPRTFTFVGFSNFVQLFTEDNRFWPIFGNTVKWLFIHCIFHVTLGTLLAFILYKKPRGWKFVRVTYMIPNIISQSAIAMIFLNLYNAQYGAVNSFLKLVGLESLQHNWLFETATAFPSVTLTWFLFAGYTTTLVLAQLLSTDESLIEAAEIDGANRREKFRYVTLPMLTSTIFMVIVLSFISYLQCFDEPYVLTKGGPGISTTTVSLYIYRNFQAQNISYASILSVVLFIIIMIITARQFKASNKWVNYDSE